MQYLWPVAMLAAASAFPAMLFERVLPRMPDHIRWTLNIGPDDTTYHFLKNIWTELIRADPQWWGKCLAFVIVVQAVVIIWQRLRSWKPPVVSVKEIKTSAGPDYFVSVKSGHRELELYQFKIKGRADYTAAEIKWLFNGGTKPDLIDWQDVT